MAVTFIEKNVFQDERLLLLETLWLIIELLKQKIEISNVVGMNNIYLLVIYFHAKSFIKILYKD